MSKVDESLLAKLESKQWCERVNAMEAISQQLKSLSSFGNIAPVLNALLQVLGMDKHHACVVLAANTVQQFVITMANDFAPFAERTLSCCLSKFKITKSTIIIALRALARSLLEMMPLEQAITVLTTGIQEKYPGIRAQSTILLGDCLYLHSPMRSCSQSSLSATQRIRLVKPLLPILTETFQARTAECREASCHAFAAVRLFLDAPDQFDLLTNGMLGSLRTSKVQVAFDELKRKATEDADSQKLGNPTPEYQAPNTEIKRDKHVHKSPDNSSSYEPQSKTSKQKRLPEKDTSRTPMRNVHTVKCLNIYSEIPKDCDVRTQLSDYFIHINLDNLTDKNWKVRLETAAQVKARVFSVHPGESKVLVLLLVLQSSSLKDTITQIRYIALETLLQLISLESFSMELSDPILQLLCEQLSPLLGDVKCTALTQKILSCLLKFTNQDCLIGCLFSCVFSVKKDMAWSAALDWLKDATIRLKLRFDPSKIVDLLKRAFAHKQVTVRDSAINLCAIICVHPQDGPLIRRELRDQSPALLARLDAETNRISKEKCPAQSSPDFACALSPRTSDTMMGNTTLLTNKPPFTAMLMKPNGSVEESEPSVDGSFGSTAKNQPTGNAPEPRGCIIALPATALNNTLFIVEAGRMAEVMEAKQMRLANLTKNTCFDSAGLKCSLTDIPSSPQLINALFSPNINSRLGGLDQLMAYLDTRDDQSDHSALTLTYAFFDLLLTWIAGGCFGCWLDWDHMDQPTPSQNAAQTLISSGLQYLTVVVSRFAQAEFQLSDQEVSLLLHVLLSDQAPSLRSGLFRNAIDPSILVAVSHLILLLRQVYPASSLVDTIVDLISSCCTSEGRLACLHEVNNLIPRFGEVRGFNLDISVKLIAQQIADPECTVRRAALDCLKLIHRFVGGRIWHLVGPLRLLDRQALENHLADKPEKQENESILPMYTTPVRRNPLRPPNTLGSTLHEATLSMNAHEGIKSLTPWTGRRRAVSPPPVHTSPAALSVLLPLIHARDSSAASEASKAAACEKLNFALNCLVKQLDVPLFHSAEDQSEGLTTEGDITADVLNNVVLGSLVDLETLILDPRTRDLLLPFVNLIVSHFGSLAQCLTKTPRNAGLKLFTNCLAGIIIVLFEQPFLASEVDDENMIYLLFNLLLLAECHRIPDAPFATSSPRRSTLLRLVNFIHTSVDPTRAFTVLLRLLHICYFGCDCTQNPLKAVRKRRSTRLSVSNELSRTETSELMEYTYNIDVGHTIAHLVLCQMVYRLRFISFCIRQLELRKVLPLLNDFLMHITEITGLKSVKSKQLGLAVPREVENCIRQMIVRLYALLGSDLISQAEGCVGHNTDLLCSLKHIASLMPNAPYKHCLPR